MEEETLLDLTPIITETTTTNNNNIKTTTMNSTPSTITRIPSPVRSIRKPISESTVAGTSKRRSSSTSTPSSSASTSSAIISKITPNLIRDKGISSSSSSKSAVALTTESSRKSGTANGKTTVGLNIEEEDKKKKKIVVKSERVSLSGGGVKPILKSFPGSSEPTILKKAPIIRSSNSDRLCTSTSDTPTSLRLILAGKRLSSTGGEGGNKVGVRKVTPISTSMRKPLVGSSTTKVTAISTTPRKVATSTTLPSTRTISSITSKPSTISTSSTSNPRITTNNSTRRLPLNSSNPPTTTSNLSTPIVTSPSFSRKKITIDNSPTPSTNTRISSSSTMKTVLTSKPSTPKPSTPLIRKSPAVVLKTPVISTIRSGKKPLVSSSTVEKGMKLKVEAGDKGIKCKLKAPVSVVEIEEKKEVKVEIGVVKDAEVSVMVEGEEEEDVLGLGIIPQVEEKRDVADEDTLRFLEEGDNMEGVEERDPRRDSWETLPPSARPSLSSSTSYNPFYPIPEVPSPTSTSPSKLTPRALSPVLVMSKKENELNDMKEEMGKVEVGNESWETENGLNASQSSTTTNIHARSPKLNTLPPSRRTSLPLLISTKIPRLNQDSQSDSSSHPSPSHILHSTLLLPPQSQSQSRPHLTPSISDGTKISHSRSSSLTSYSPLLSSDASTLSSTSISTTSSLYNTTATNINQLAQNDSNNLLPPPPPPNHTKPPPRRSSTSKSNPSPSISILSTKFVIPANENKISIEKERNHRHSTTLEELLKEESARSSRAGGGNWLLSKDDDGFMTEMSISHGFEEEDETVELEKDGVAIGGRRSSTSPITTTSTTLLSAQEKKKTSSDIQQSIEIWRQRCEALEDSLRIERHQFALERQAWELQKSNFNSSPTLDYDELHEKKRHSIELSWSRAAGSMEISRRNYLALADAVRSEREIVGSQLESLSVLTALMKNLSK